MNEDDVKNPPIDEEIVPENDVSIEADENLDDSVLVDENLGDTVKKLKEKVKILEKEKQQYLTGWQRTKADYVNSKKEAEGRTKDLIKYGNENLISELLPALDAFDMAMANKEAWEKVDKNWRAGVEYIYSQILSALSKVGLTQEDPKGKEFDVFKHHSIETVPTGEASQKGKVAEVLQKGYLLNGKEIRPATVKVYE